MASLRGRSFAGGAITTVAVVGPAAAPVVRPSGSGSDRGTSKSECLNLAGDVIRRGDAHGLPQQRRPSVHVDLHPTHVPAQPPGEKEACAGDFLRLALAVVDAGSSFRQL